MELWSTDETLRVAALAPARSLAESRWAIDAVAVHGARSPASPADATMFVAQVTGKSMEAGVPDGSYCLFRRFDAGAAPSAVALDGRRVVVELREGAESDLGGRYTLKRWRVSKIEPSEGVVEIELRPDNREYRSLRMRRSDGEIRVVAELLEVLA